MYFMSSGVISITEPGIFGCGIVCVVFSNPQLGIAACLHALSLQESNVQGSLSSQLMDTHVSAGGSGMSSGSGSVGSGSSGGSCGVSSGSSSAGSSVSSGGVSESTGGSSGAVSVSSSGGVAFVSPSVGSSAGGSVLPSSVISSAPSVAVSLSPASCDASGDGLDSSVDVVSDVSEGLLGDSDDSDTPASDDSEASDPEDSDPESEIGDAPAASDCAMRSGASRTRHTSAAAILTLFFFAMSDVVPYFFKLFDEFFLLSLVEIF